MKNVTTLFAYAMIAIGLAACGNQNNGTQQGYYNAQGQWVQTGSTTNYGTVGAGGCVPLGQQLSFTIQGASVNSAVVLGGLLPANSTRPGQYGQAVMGGSMQQGYAGGLTLVKQTYTGAMMQLSVNSGSVSGMLQLDPSTLQQLMMMGGAQTQQYPYNNQQNYNSGACISSIAIDVVYQAPVQTGYSQQPMQGQIMQALVYLYMNNGQPIGPIKI